MDSCIKVRTTPNIIGREFRREGGLDIRFFEALAFKDPAPDMDNDTWSKIYGNNEYVYRVIIRHEETERHLRGGSFTYSSLSDVKKALDKMIKRGVNM